MERALRQTAGRIVLTVAAILILVALILFLGSLKNIPTAQYVQLTVDGIRAGSIYALIALGFVVIYSVTGIINFAQGEFVMLGAMSSISFYGLDLPLPPPLKMLLAIVLSVVCVAVVGMVVERVAIYPARRAPVVTLIIITIGVALALRALALIIWGADPYFLPAFTTLKMEDLTFRMGGVALKAQSFWVWGTVAVVLAALAFFFERTIMGKALRACAVNRRAAELMGINPSRMSLLAFALAAALGAIGGIVLAPTLRPIYDMGLKLGLKGFVAAIMGGLVSSPGAVIGGLILGVAENVGAGVTKAGLKDIISLIILVLILLFRPQGIIGGVERGVEEM